MNCHGRLLRDHGRVGDFIHGGRGGRVGVGGDGGGVVVGVGVVADEAGEKSARHGV